MPLDSHPSSPLNFISQVARLYHAMEPFAGPAGNAEPGLGGQLLYAGLLDAEGRALLVAANIAGAASLAATADGAMQKQAVRDGVADFLVTSLDEALRILKNEIRKRQPVAVCVALAPESVAAEMLERGVLPDLLAPGGPDAEQSPFASQGARRLNSPRKNQIGAAGVSGHDFSRAAKPIKSGWALAPEGCFPANNPESGLFPQPLQPPSTEGSPALLTWSVAQAPARWLPVLDAMALDCLAPEAAWQRRWLRFAPRYLGRQAQGLRLLLCTRETGKKFIEEVNDRSARGEIGVAVEMHLTDPGEWQVESFEAGA